MVAANNRRIARILDNMNPRFSVLFYMSIFPAAKRAFADRHPDAIVGIIVGADRD